MNAVNLLPPEQRTSNAAFAGHSGGLAFVVVGALAAAMLGSAAYAKTNGEVEQAKANAQAMEQAAQEYSTAAPVYAPYEQAVSAVRTRVAAIEGLAASRFDWAGTMRELARVIPPTVQVQNMSLSVRPGSGGGGTSAPARDAIQQPAVVIQACAKDTETVADLLGRLEAMRRVTNVSLDNTVRAEDTSGGADCTVAKRPQNFLVVVHYQSGTSKPAAEATPGTVGAGALGAAPGGVAPTTPGATAQTGSGDAPAGNEPVPIPTTPDTPEATTP